MTTAMTTEKSRWPLQPQSIAEQARENNINLLYVFDKDNTKSGGYTVAYRPSQGYVGRRHGKMVDVAVAYCSEGDTFSKKIGREQAIENFLNGRFIQVPAMLYGEDELHNCLREMFQWDLDRLAIPWNWVTA